MEETELFLRKKFKVPKGKTLTEVHPPFDCWRDVIKLMEEYITDPNKSP